MISIHALLAESDRTRTSIGCACTYFYPRSPCGERLRYPVNLQPEAGFLSTLSLRRATDKIPNQRQIDQFLSTLSLRRDDLPGLLARPFFIISIHALLAESDINRRSDHIKRHISIHALLAESDLPGLLARPFFIILSTLSLRRATFCRVGLGS